ncbi:glycosyltransferase 87 family protein [Coprobacter sp.]
MTPINSTKIFTGITFLLACTWIILLFADPSHQLHVFFLKLDNFFADFYNTLIYIADKNPYYNELNGTCNKNYLPFSYMILYPFTFLTNYSSISLEDCWNSKIAVLSCFFFTLLSLFLLFHSLYLLCKKYQCPQIILFIIFFSSINLYTLERGNEIMISAACINYFIYLKDEKNRKWYGIICLSIASVLKIFPAIFSLYYLYKKDYKSFFKYVIISFLLAFLPFLFFKNGFGNIVQLYENVKEQTAIYGMSFSIYRFGLIPLFLQIGKSLNIEAQSVMYEAGKYITYILGLLSIGLFFKTKSSFFRFGLLAMFCALVPQQAFVYNGIYIFPLLIMLLSANNKLSSKQTHFIMFLFIWILLPVQLNKFTPKINNIAMILMWISLIFMAIRQYIQDKKMNSIQIK